MNNKLLQELADVVADQKKFKAEADALVVIPPAALELREKVKQLAAREAELRPKIVKYLNEEEQLDKVALPFGTFSILKNETWKYSDRVLMVENSLVEYSEKVGRIVQIMKDHEEKEGIAEKTEGTPTLRFLPPKAA